MPSTPSQRASLFLLVAATAALFLWAVARHQQLTSERTIAGSLRKEVEVLRAGLTEADAGRSALRADAGRLSEEIDKLKTEAARTAQWEARWKELGDQVDRVRKEGAERGEKALALGAALAEVKAQLVEPTSVLLARLGDLAKIKETGARTLERLALLEARLESSEKALAAWRDRQDRDQVERQAELGELRRELEALEKLARSKPAAATIPVEKAPPLEPVATTIEAVEPSGKVVVLAAGGRKGLEVGHLLMVSRQGKPVGRVRVVKVYPELAGAEVVDTSPGEAIQVKDQAATRAPAKEPGGLTLESGVEPAPARSAPPPPPSPREPPPGAGGNGAARP